MSPHEQLGLDLAMSRLLVVDWVSPHSAWDDLLAFVFDGGTLAEAAVDRLDILNAELNAFELCTTDQARERLRSYVWARLAAALEAAQLGTVRYLEDGKPVL